MTIKHSYITRIFCLIFFIGFTSVTINAQILGVNEALFTDQPFFNTNFIKVNNIKTITGIISSKKVRDIIRSKGLKTYYKFNRKGELVQQYKSHLSQKKIDTTSTFYRYNQLGKIVSKRKSEGLGFYSYQYQYDLNNNIVSQTYSRDENKFNSKNKFELKKRYIIKTDSFSYQLNTENQTQKYFYNSYGIKYKQQTNTFDSLGYLIEEKTKFIIGNNKTKTSYEYDNYGRLYKKQYVGNLTQSKKTTAIYTYDEIGNVLEIKNYLASEHVTTKEFLYDEKTMLLSAIIIQDIKAEQLRIIKYRYTFYKDAVNYTENSK